MVSAADERGGARIRNFKTETDVICKSAIIRVNLRQSIRKTMNTAAIVVAAGKGRRMGGVCKALIELEDKPLLCYSLDLFQASRLVSTIVVVVPPGLLKHFSHEFAGRWKHPKISAWVEGGRRRRDSVMAGVEVVPADAAFVAIHDAARPFADKALLERVFAAARRKGAAVPGIEITDTIKEIDARRIAVRTIDRTKLRAIQTPQVFEAALLRRAYRVAADKGLTVTDDASLVEQLGHEVLVVEGNRDNIKITVPEDIERGKEILKKAKSLKSKA
jgi:2-C-methyl-D-erythritol 4-phosphate cytidylyltransferase